MRKLIALQILLAVVAAAGAQTGKQWVQQYNSRLLKAKSLVVAYTVQTIGGAPATIIVKLSKPNLLRIDTPWETVDADGVKITTYDSVGRTFFVMPDTLDNLETVFSQTALNPWAGFFDPLAMEKVPEALLQGQHELGGKTLTAVRVTMDQLGAKKVTLYLDSNADLWKAETDLSRDNSAHLLSVSELQLGDSLLPDADFSYLVPKGAQQITLEDVRGSKWYDNFRDAALAASDSKKLVFMLFSGGQSVEVARMATELFPTAAFKRQSKNFVFMQADPKTNKALAARFAVRTSPVIVLVNPRGSVLGRIEGFPGAGSVLAAMNSAHKAGG